MNKRVKTTIITLIIAAASLIGWLLFKNVFSDVTYNLKENHKYVYTFVYKGSTFLSFLKPQTAMKSAEVMNADTDFDFDVVIKVYDKNDGHYKLGYSVSDIRKAYVAFSGKNIFKDSASISKTFNGQELYVKMSPQGEILSIHSTDQTSVLFENIMKMVVGETQVYLQKEKEWKHNETTSVGTAQVEYTVKESSLEGAALDKEKKQYSDIPAMKMNKQFNTKKVLNNSFSIFFKRDGYLKNYIGKEEINIKDTKGRKLYTVKNTFSYNLKKIEQFLPSPERISFFDRMNKSTLKDVSISEKARENLLLQQAKGMTIKEMVNTIDRYARTGEVYKRDEFKWRAVGFLKLYPKKAWELEKVFNQSNMSSKSRVMVLGLLIGAGHSTAQEVMRKLIASDVAKKDKFYLIYKQNLAFITQPDAETVSYVLKDYNDSKNTGSYKHSSSLTLGATAKNLYKNGEVELAEECNDLLVNDLLTASKEEDKIVALDSLGNIGNEDNIPHLLEYAQKEDQPRVAAAALAAMRLTQTEKTEDVLLKSSRSKDHLIQKQSINTLTKYELEESKIEEIYEQIRSGSISHTNYLDVVSMMSKYIGKYPGAVLKVLEEILPRIGNNPHLETKVKNMIKQIKDIK